MNYKKAQELTPKDIQKSKSYVLGDEIKIKTEEGAYSDADYTKSMAADPVEKYMTASDIEKEIIAVRKKMLTAAKNLEFIEAAQYSDAIIRLENLVK